jgi:hypothetical protein
MKFWLFPFFVLFGLWELSAQQLLRSSIGCMGSSQMMEGVLIRQTVGQPGLTTVEHAEGMVLSQGFQQPLLPFPLEGLRKRTQIESLLYPNPNRGIFKALVMGEEGLIYDYSFSDGQGRVFKKGEIHSQQAQWVSCELCLAGVYYFQLFRQGVLVGAESVILH